MKKNVYYSPVFLLSLGFIFLLQGCTKSSNYTISHNQDFNAEWKFILSDNENFSDPGFDDSEWQMVDLPHDWSIIDYSEEDSMHVGPFKRDLAGGKDVGYLRDGTAWYRKGFRLPALKQNQQVILHFDGVQSMMQLWVNGKSVGEHAYGYTPFYFNITSYLEKGDLNYIAVRTTNPGENSRWFAGAGIYRSVQISIVNEVSVDVWGVAASTPEVNQEAARVEIASDIRNYSKLDQEVTCQVKIFGPMGSIFEIPEEKILVMADSLYTYTINKEIKEPVLWDIQNPALYTAVVNIWRGEKQLESYPVTFGIRSLEYSAESGFKLNGKEVLLKGACMHHDNGLLGAAAFPAAEERRVKIMKENGYNAIRTSHNPPSEQFLNACDRLGMLVIDESFDAWRKPKRKNDYSVHFDKWWKKDLTAMILRDRNHPSVIMWSFGNEIQERGDSSGLAIAADLINTIKSIDTTRPVTQAICHFWDNPGKTWEYTEKPFALLDVSGYNYQWQMYEADHEKFPERIMYGSESVPKEAWENWEMVKKHPYVIGDFVWTGMDYIGESGIGNTIVVTDPATKIDFLRPWPWYVAWCGDIDIIGNKKPQSYYRDVIWGNSNLEILVQKPLPGSATERVSYWGWPDELNSWTWTEYMGQTMDVIVYSVYPTIVLKLNDEIIGRKDISQDDKYTARFSVDFQPGKLEAVGIYKGKEMESFSIRTASEISELSMNPEKDNLIADRNEIAYIQVEALDSLGTWIPTDYSELSVEVSGAAELLAAGNGSPRIGGSISDGEFNLYQGKGLIIIRSTGNPGEIQVKVNHKILGELTCSMRSL